MHARRYISTHSPYIRTLAEQSHKLVPSDSTLHRNCNCAIVHLSSYLSNLLYHSQSLLGIHNFSQLLATIHFFLLTHTQFHHVNNTSRMAPNSCTVAVEIAEHHITIHFKSDEELFQIYLNADNIALTSSKRSWSKRSGKEYTLCQNK